ncbi:MAG: ABC transporter permease [Bacteroidales bacterium]|nr:ABC transporter permease [Bacteroidales bacterium]
MKIIQKLQQGLSWFSINLLGLSVAMACVIAAFLYTGNELSYDRMHSKTGRIYRVTTDSNDGETSMHPARVAGDWPGQLMTGYHAIEKMVRLVPFRKAVVKIGDQKFYTLNAFSTDSSFFDVFDFKIISGNREKALSLPGRAFISQSLAIKYYGSTDIIGREITIFHQQDPNPKTFIIDGVMEDFPGNSHFHAELLTSFTSVEDRTTWAYTYYLMKEGTNVEALRSDIQSKWEKENSDDSPVQILHLQPLADIHLFSHKTREMEKNGDIRSLILLGSGVLIIFLIAMINFLNLNRVQFISAMRSVKVRMIIGASKLRLACEMASRSLVLSLASFGIGMIIALEIGNILGSRAIQSSEIKSLIWLALGYILVIALVAVLPLFTSGFSLSLKETGIRRNRYAIPLVVQFALSVIAIICTIGLYRQMQYMRNQHPASRNANMLVLSDNPWDVIQRYETLKSQLLENTCIKNVTAAMEEPGGDVLDNSPFEMEGIDPNNELAINIFTNDPNFFDFLNIKPLAGTTRIEYTPSIQWELDAVQLSTLRNTGKAKQIVAEREHKLGNYREKYILNQSALNMLGIADPREVIGKRFRLTFFLPDLFPEGEVIGVVPDIRYTNLYNEEKPLVFTPRKTFNSTFIIEIDPLQRKKAIETLHSTWEKVNPEFPLQYEYITDAYRKVYTAEYAQSNVLSLFALISVIISTMGVFAIAVFSMQRRTKEIGIRKVNGARVIDIMKILNKKFVLWVTVAFVIACPIAWYAMHKWLEHFAYRITLSWWIFATAGAVALAVTLLMVSWQSWRAASRNPVEALRYE